MLETSLAASIALQNQKSDFETTTQKDVLLLLRADELSLYKTVYRHLVDSRSAEKGMKSKKLTLPRCQLLDSGTRVLLLIILLVPVSVLAQEAMDPATRYPLNGGPGGMAAFPTMIPATSYSMPTAVSLSSISSGSSEGTSTNDSSEAAAPAESSAQSDSYSQPVSVSEPAVASSPGPTPPAEKGDGHDGEPSDSDNGSDQVRWFKWIVLTLGALCFLPISSRRRWIARAIGGGLLIYGIFGL
jgi:hypothetical protein